MNPPSNIAGFPEPRIIAIAGDWHGNFRWARHILTTPHLRGVEAVVHTGDFGFWPGRGGQEYLDRLEEVLAKLGIPMYWVKGNHEWQPELAAWPVTDGVQIIRPHIIHLPAGFRWTWQGQTWLALGGAVSVDREQRVAGIDWWPDEVITDLDVEAAIAGGPADVMICHDAPRGVGALDMFLSVNGFRLSPIIQSDADHSRDQVRKVVDAVKPRFLFHGHYHHKYSDDLHGDGFTTLVAGLDCDGTSMRGNVIRGQLPIGEKDQADED
ncbi:metallophosphoesterase family protein [Mycolicibacterium conceptionense]|uniref:metallophosphoesterase family protein n=1 Tax=Mycolicibacterium conceptionense TaxID=451644 RepID=UPI000662C3CA|nr:metallophosphoesterase [Mycolicibacterium conceptionense]